MAGLTVAYSQTQKVWPLVQGSMPTNRNRPSTDRTSLLSRRTAALSEIADLVESRWDDLRAETRTLISAFVYDVIEPRESWRDRVLSRLRYKLMVLATEPDELSRFAAVVNRLVGATLAAIERDDEALSGELESVVAEAYADPGQILTRDNVRDYVRAL